MSMFAVVDSTRSLELLSPVNIFPPNLTQHLCVFIVVVEMRINTCVWKPDISDWLWH